MSTPTQKVRFIQPRNVLKEKVGGGGLDPKIIEKAQKVIETSDVDFGPMAKELIQKFAQSINDAQAIDLNSAEDTKKALENIAAAIMQIKASSGMFKYELMGDVANVSLLFLEELNGFNSDVFNVLKTHKATLDAIIASGLKGHCGREGDVLVSELQKANKRYFAKHGR